MAKRKIRIEITEADSRKAMARMNWERSVSEMAEGRRQRAALGHLRLLNWLKKKAFQLLFMLLICP